MKQVCSHGGPTQCVDASASCTEQALKSVADISGVKHSRSLCSLVSEDGVEEEEEEEGGRVKKAFRTIQVLSKEGEKAAKEEEAEGQESSPVALSNRERLDSFRNLMSSCVAIPDSWSGESSLSEWVDWTVVNTALQPEGLMGAKAAMMDHKTARL